MRALWFAALVGFLFFHACQLRAEPVAVDVNLVTGIDVSSSVTIPETKVELDGLAIAMQSAEIQAAIRAGRHHRIGFAVYLWSDGGCPLVVGWRVIASPEDAAAMAADLSAGIEKATAEARSSGLTGVAAAMVCGGAIIAAAPYKADRAVLNIVTDGTENVQDENAPAAVRDALVAQGINVNAVALDPAVRDYLQTHVAGGPLSFVLTVEKPEELVDAWRRKFFGDLASR